MKAPNRIHGFSVRKDHQAALRRLYVTRILWFMVPFVVLLVIDMSLRFQLLVPFILLIPVFDLKNQTYIWYKYVRRFGMPTMSVCWKMWQLDARRGYDARTGSIKREERGHILEMVAGMVVIAALLCFLWTKTGFTSFLYPAVWLVVLTVKGLIRRARPPAVLFLAASGYQRSQLQLGVQEAVRPLEVISCLYHKKTAARLFDGVLHFTSFRTGDVSIWKEMVTSLVQLSQLVVIDIRNATRPVQFEIELALKTLTHDRLFFVGAEPDQENIPPSRCFTEIELIEGLRPELYGGKENEPVHGTSGIKVYEDKRNGYFMFAPPIGWQAYEYKDPRTKVRFSHPTAPGVFIRFIVREAPGESYYSMMLADMQMVHQVEAMGFSCKVKENEFLGMECSEVFIQSPKDSEITMLRKFLAGGLHFNISYGSPTKALFDRYWDEVMRSLDTIAIMKEFRSAPEKVQKQHIANRVRLAELAADHWNVDEAKRILADAAEKFPDNDLIRNAIEELHNIEQD